MKRQTQEPGHWVFCQEWGLGDVLGVQLTQARQGRKKVSDCHPLVRHEEGEREEIENRGKTLTLSLFPAASTAQTFPYPVGRLSTLRPVASKDIAFTGTCHRDFVLTPGNPIRNILRPRFSVRERVPARFGGGGEHFSQNRIELSEQVIRRCLSTIPSSSIIHFCECLVGESGVIIIIFHRLLHGVG